MTFRDKKVLVAGMARSGASSAKLLSRLGAKLTLYDAKPRTQLPETTQAAIRDLEFEDCLGQPEADVLRGVDAVIVSPGLPPSMPLLQKARSAGIPVLAEIELGYLSASGDIAAITGTNGKTTTTALVGEIFKNAGRRTFVLGNIGTPLTERALDTSAGDMLVVETAALQLDDIASYRPSVSAILNITPDHLDRYGSMERYTSAKARIYENQTDSDWCVLNWDDAIVRSLAPSVKARILWFSLEPQTADGVYAEDGQIAALIDGRRVELMSASDVTIPGTHNLQNALAASAVALSQGVKPDVVAQTLRTFPGVEHRIETVCEKDGVLFINDSKGTNPDATLKAVAAMSRPTVLILGGFDKHADFVPFMQSISSDIKHAVVLGQTADRLMDAAAECGVETVERADTFDDAVLAAARAAQAGDAVLLSPACASWDMFDNFEERGRRFKQIVRELL